MAAVAALLVAGSALAQTDPHHPPGAATPPAPTAPAAPAAPGMAAPAPGGGMPMMGMMQMMTMMGQGGMGMADMGMHGMSMRGMAMAERVEGRIAFLKTELKITDAQGKVWNEFAQSLKNNAKRLAEVRDSAAKSGGAPAASLAERLDTQERWLAARLEGARSIKTTFGHFYAFLSADQKKAADELMPMHLGLMPSGLMSMGMMSGGGMMVPMGGNVR
jgi:hypothetical protein